MLAVSLASAAVTVTSRLTRAAVSLCTRLQLLPDPASVPSSRPESSTILHSASWSGRAEKVSSLLCSDAFAEADSSRRWARVRRSSSNAASWFLISARGS